MVKKAAKHKVAATKPRGPREFVGWGYWLFCFAALFGPSWYLAYRVAFEDQRNGLVPWITAFALAALGAGLLSVAVNYALRARAAAQKKQAARKKTKREHS